MAYIHGHSRHALGGVLDVASAAQAIVTDPCLSPVAQLVLRLHAAEQPKPPAPRPGVPPPPPPPPVKGVGLCYAVKPLRALVWVRERPWVAPVGLAVVLGGIFLAGVATGKRSRR
jgi:hypothetical protein